MKSIIFHILRSHPGLYNTALKLAGLILRPWFVFNGKKPWTTGYHLQKWYEIKQQIYRKNWSVPETSSEGYGHRIDERVVELPWVIHNLSNVDKSTKLLDAGSALNFPVILSHSKLEQRQIFISNLNAESHCLWQKEISYVYEDFRNSAFKDEYFDEITCVSTLEHVGMDNTFLYSRKLENRNIDRSSHLEAIKEFHRMLKKGGKLYLTIPYGKDADRGWFQVFDAKSLDRIIKTFNGVHVKEYIFAYEPEGWVVSSRKESKDATCFDVHTETDYRDDYAAFSGPIACFEITK